MTILMNNKAHGEAIAREAGVMFHPLDTVISRVRGEKLLGGVIYKDFTGASASIHVAGFDPLWINRDMLWVVFHYGFIQLGCKQLLGTVKSNNHKVLEFDRKLGFTTVAIIPEVFVDSDMVVLAMKREECRWLGLKPRELREAA